MNTDNLSTPSEDTSKNDSPSISALEPLPSLDVTASKSESHLEGENSVGFLEQEKTSQLVSKAQSFLESPELDDNNPESKRQYLVTKGLSEETADELQKALSSIPVIPPRTYPEALVAPPRSRLLGNLMTLYYFFAYAAGASAILTFAYSKFILPRWSKMVVAKRRLREHQLGLLRKLKDELVAEKDSTLTASSVAPTEESKPTLSTKLQELRAQVPNTPQQNTRQYTLQSLSNLTGYLSSQIHLTSALNSAMQPYQFQFSMPGTKSTLAKDDTHEQIKKDIRALKGLLINRRTFLQSPSIPRPTSAQRMH